MMYRVIDTEEDRLNLPLSQHKETRPTCKFS